MKRVITAVITLITLITFTRVGYMGCPIEIMPQKYDDVAILTMCADECVKERKNLLYSFGHAFFTLENISDESMCLYNYEVKPHEIVTFSWWAVDRHMGIWFNIESNYIHKANRYQAVEFLSMYINADDMEKLSQYMERHDTYSPLSNCSKQVVRCWNEIAEKGEEVTEYSVMTPQRIVEQTEFVQEEKDMIPFNQDIFYYDTESGTFCHYTMEA